MSYNNLQKKYSKYDNDNFYNSKDRLVKKYITTKGFGYSLKFINNKAFKYIDGINKMFFRITKDGVYIQYK